MRSIFKWATIVVLGLVGVAGIGGFVWLRTSLPAIDGEIAVPGLGATVTVTRDRHGIPRIQADSLRDGWYGLGFVHAQDRLWQMEAMRRLGSGRLAEVVGPKALASDRFFRLLSLGRLAEAQVARLKPETREALDAYAAGVNGWLATRGGALPPTFLVLRFAPEAWRPADSLIWAKLMAMRLSGNWRDELLRARLSARLSEAQLSTLWPSYPDDGPITVARADEPGTDALLERLAAALPDVVKAPGGMSNAWAVTGARTPSGRPLLANDPHLGLDTPILWYLARIHTPQWQGAGATVPGVPLVVLGHNGRIAWGITSTHSDQQDLFIERLDPADPNRYLTPEGSRLFSVRKETIRVRGEDDQILTVRESRHGPVLSDLVPVEKTVGGPGTVVALAAAYLDPEDRTPDATMGLNHARDWTSALAALESFHAPQQNITYADVDGNIGFVAPGRVPVRRSGRGWMPAPGWTGEADWIGHIPFDQLPRVLNPPSGVLVNANNRITPKDYPHFITDDWARPYRAQRIRDVIGAEAPHGPDDAQRLQMDAVSLMARDLMALLGEARPASAGGKRALQMLREWDGAMARDRPEPLLFTAWLRELNRRVYADELGSLMDDYWRLRPHVIKRIWDRDRAWCDDPRTLRAEGCEGLAAAALDRVVAEGSGTHGPDLASWRWGQVHRFRLSHRILGQIPVIGGLLDSFVETDGGQFTVNRGGMRVGRDKDPYAHVHGSGLRAVYDLADLSKSRFIIATGQSGNPLSAHFDDLAKKWSDGGMVTLDVLDDAEGVLRLVPSTSDTGRQE